MTIIRDKRESGFTLLELAISTVIIGLLMAGILSAYAVHMKKKQVDITNSNIEAVNDAIVAFVRENGFFPCPAVRTEASATADCNGTITTTPNILAGVVPITVMDQNGNFRQLVPGEEALDGWRNRLTYVVTAGMARDMTNPASVNPDFNVVQGAIRVDKLDGTPAEERGRFLVLSHGQDGVGAVSAAGVARRPCGQGGVNDNINCDNQWDRFVSIGISGVRSTSGDANNFDDFVSGDTLRNLPETGGDTGSFIYASTTEPTCPDGWDEVSFSPTTVRVPLENAASGVHTTTQNSVGMTNITLPTATPPAWNTPSRTCKSQRGYRGQIEVSAHNMQDQSQNPCPSGTERIGNVTRTALQQVQVASQCDDNYCAAGTQTVIQPVSETRVVCADPAD